MLMQTNTYYDYKTPVVTYIQKNRHVYVHMYMNMFMYVY
jgi:hypothetical protein